MGSFDLSCSFSGISLFNEQPVKLFFVVHNNLGNYCMYPFEKYIPCSFNISASYYDYGRFIIDAEQPNWKEFVRFIDENSKYKYAGEEELQDDIMCGKVLVNDLVVSICAIHKRLYNDVLMSSVETWDGIIDVEELKIRYEKQITRDERIINFATKSLVLSGGGIFYHDYDDFLPNKEHLIDNMAELGMMHLNMVRLNKFLCPSMYAGQEPYYDDALSFHSKCCDLINKLKEQYDDYYEEEIEDEKR